MVDCDPYFSCIGTLAGFPLIFCEFIKISNDFEYGDWCLYCHFDFYHHVINGDSIFAKE